MAKRKKQGGFPKAIYVHIEETSDGGNFLNAERDFEESPDGIAVAIYELKEVKTKRVTHTLEDED